MAKGKVAKSRSQSKSQLKSKASTRQRSRSQSKSRVATKVAKSPARTARSQKKVTNDFLNLDELIGASASAHKRFSSASKSRGASAKKTSAKKTSASKKKTVKKTTSRSPAPRRVQQSIGLDDILEVSGYSARKQSTPRSASKSATKSVTKRSASKKSASKRSASKKSATKRSASKTVKKTAAPSGNAVILKSFMDQLNSRDSKNQKKNAELLSSIIKSFGSKTVSSTEILAAAGAKTGRR